MVFFLPENPKPDGEWKLVRLDIVKFILCCNLEVTRGRLLDAKYIIGDACMDPWFLKYIIGDEHMN